MCFAGQGPVQPVAPWLGRFLGSLEAQNCSFIGSWANFIASGGGEELWAKIIAPFLVVERRGMLSRHPSGSISSGSAALWRGPALYWKRVNVVARRKETSSPGLRLGQGWSLSPEMKPGLLFGSRHCSCAKGRWCRSVLFPALSCVVSGEGSVASVGPCHPQGSRAGAQVGPCCLGTLQRNRELPAQLFLRSHIS